MARYGSWPRYVPVAERRRKAAQELARLSKKGQSASPVVVTGRAIANTFWGKAWCETMEGFGDYANRLPRGRTYVRNGSVVDLKISPTRVDAMVIGSAIYSVNVTIKALSAAQWEALRKDCAGEIASLVDLLQGRLSKAVMERVCEPGTGLFPRASEIKFSCTCPDSASMCKHIAATFYGIGARLDHQPDLLFRLRDIDQMDLFANIGGNIPKPNDINDPTKVLEVDDMAALFGLDLIEESVSEVVLEPEREQDKPAAKSKPKRKAAPATRDYEFTKDGYLKWWKK